MAFFNRKNSKSKELPTLKNKDEINLEEVEIELQRVIQVCDSKDLHKE